MRADPPTDRHGFHEKTQQRAEEGDCGAPSFHSPRKMGRKQTCSSTPSTMPASPSPSLGDDYIDLEMGLNTD